MRATFMKQLVLGMVFVSMYAHTARAEEEVIKLCPKLADEKTYDKEHEDFRFITAGKDGWIFRSDYDLKQNMEDFDLSEWSLNSFTRLRHALQKRGTELSVVMIPTRGLVGYPYLLPPHDTSYDHNKAKVGYLALLEGFKKAGIITADTQDVDTISGFFLKRDNHWTATGARYMAQKLAEAVKASPVYAGLTKAEFVTASAKPPQPIDANDNFLEFVEEQCGTMPVAEKISEVFSTTRKVEGDAGAALLGEDVKPEVVLLGTSNSTEPEPSYANFVGFLREALGVDVNNDSIMGGSMRGAIGNYVLNGDYDKYKPKLIVWELSAHYGFEQRAFFREIIPAVYGACSDEEALAIAKGTVNPKETVVMKDLAAKTMFSYNFYLVLELEDKDERDVRVDFIHMNGKEDDMEFERSERNFPTNSGIYFSELKFGINEPVDSIKVTLKNGKGAYKAKMCKVPH